MAAIWAAHALPHAALKTRAFEGGHFAQARAVLGIAAMTDIDQPGEAATAWYGDITLGKKQ